MHMKRLEFHKVKVEAMYLETIFVASQLFKLGFGCYLNLLVFNRKLGSI